MLFHRDFNLITKVSNTPYIWCLVVNRSWEKILRLSTLYVFVRDFSTFLPFLLSWSDMGIVACNCAFPMPDILLPNAVKSHTHTLTRTHTHTHTHIHRNTHTYTQTDKRRHHISAYFEFSREHIAHIFDVLWSAVFFWFRLIADCFYLGFAHF